MVVHCTWPGRVTLYTPGIWLVSRVIRGLLHTITVVDGAGLFEGADGSGRSSERIVAVHGQRIEGDGR